jgi:hypothetical protein
MPRTALILSIVLAACGRSGAPGPASDGRLNGEWEIALTVQPTLGASASDSMPTRGTVAFVPNQAGVRVASFAGVPQQVGTHNLRLERLVPSLDLRSATPAAAGSSSQDSVHLVLDPDTDEPILLRGVWRGAEVTGDWLIHRRAGIDREGRFSLRRPP